MKIKTASGFRGIGYEFDQTFQSPLWESNNLIQDLTVSVNDQDGGKILYLELLGQGIVMIQLAFRQLKLPREIGINQDQLGIRKGLPGILRENFLVQFNTGRTPIGSMELEEDVLSLRLGLGQGIIKIGQPSVLAGMSAKGAQKEAEYYSDRGYFLHVSNFRLRPP
jgi:hypothetical protein